MGGENRWEGLVDACSDEYKSTIEQLVEYAKEYIDESDDDDESADFEEFAWNAVTSAGVRVFDCIYLQEAVAYIVGSGLVFDAVRGELDFDNSPIEVMKQEAYDLVKDYAEEKFDEGED